MISTTRKNYSNNIWRVSYSLYIALSLIIILALIISAGCTEITKPTGMSIESDSGSNSFSNTIADQSQDNTLNNTQRLRLSELLDRYYQTADRPNIADLPINNFDADKLVIREIIGADIDKEGYADMWILGCQNISDKLDNSGNDGVMIVYEKNSWRVFSSPNRLNGTVIDTKNIIYPSTIFESENSQIDDAFRKSADGKVSITLIDEAYHISPNDSPNFYEVVIGAKRGDE